ncbi:hypothetical protein C6P42_001680 [Pichia californica]|nr:hypothetical protein C6P42_001680 [[Candida] californica]
MDLQTTVSLIETLYSPNQDYQVILQAQKQLQFIQKQQNANILAHELLQLPSQNIQFFGALTYTVYFTNHLNEINLNDFISILLDEIIDSLKRNLSNLIINKLLSNLAKVYIKSCNNDNENNPSDLLLKHLQSINYNENLFINLSLISSKIFAEELSISIDLIKKEQHEIILSNLFNKTIQNILNSFPLSLINKNLWLDCLQSWMLYITKIEFDYSLNKIDLNSYFNLIINFMINYNDIDSLNLISEVYDLNPSLFNYNNKFQLDSILFSNWTINFIKLNENNFENLSKLSRFITLFLNSDLLNLASKIIDKSFDYKFEFLLNLTNFNGNPIIDETFSVDLLDFWILFTECFINDIDNIYLLLKNDNNKIIELNEKSQDYFENLSQIYWEKCHILDFNNNSDNDDADDLQDIEDQFINFRRDISELFETLFSISRIKIFNNLTNSIINNLSTTTNLSINQIKNIETSLYLLTSISSILTENGILPEFLNDMNLLFKSKFLEKILLIENNNNNENQYNKYLIKNSIKFLSEINWFYENNEIGKFYINEVLIYLFQNLNNNNYQDLSSKAILMITDSCRYKIINLLDDFENAAKLMIINKFNVEINVRSRIIRSYANILQTIENFELQSNKISNFLNLIYNESINAFKIIELNKGNSIILQDINNFLYSMISSLVGLAKGLKLPNDWEDYYEENPNKVKEIYNYWRFNDKFKINELCLKLILLYSFPNEFNFNFNFKNKFFFEQILNFFKCGLTEAFPGPFVIKEDLIIEYILKCCKYFQQINIKNNNELFSSINKIIELYGLVINSYHISMTISKITNIQFDIIDLKMDIIINEIFFKQFNEIMIDPDLIQSIFTLFSNIISKYPNDLLKNKEIIKILKISIDQIFINNQQRFIIISISKLWCNLIYLRKGKIEDIKKINEILINKEIGQYLVYNLMKGFINTSRSNIEFFIDIIRALTSKFSKYLSNWIIKSFEKINFENFNNKIIKIEDINLFIKQLLLTRGNRAANKVIQEFWFKITGMIDYGM